MFGVVFVVVVALLGGYLARREVARREAAQRLERALSRAVAPLDVTLTGEARSPGETSAAHLLAILAVVRYRLTKAGAPPYVAPARAELLRGREEEPPALRELRDARRALVRDPAFCTLAQTCDPLDSGASPRTPEEALAQGISRALGALVIAVYRARYQGHSAPEALRRTVERFRASLEGRGTDATPGAVARARRTAALPPWSRLRRARGVLFRMLRRLRAAQGREAAKAAWRCSLSHGRNRRRCSPGGACSAKAEGRSRPPGRSGPLRERLATR
jgi:hypothetical protein